MNVLITGALPCKNEVEKRLKDLGCTVSFLQWETDAPEHPETVEYCICCNLFRHSDIRKFKALRAVQLTSAGVDESLARYAAEHGIALFRAIGVYSIPIAEFAVMQILNLAKGTAGFIRNQADRVWVKNRSAIELYGKKALIIGYGEIGRETAKRLNAFGMTVFCANRTEKSDPWLSEWFPLDDLADRIGEFDVIALSIAHTASTDRLIDSDLIFRMKTGCIFVNVSRGAVVDQSALLASLREGKFRGAALDVLETEPPSSSDPIWGVDGCLLTPHNAFVSDAAGIRLAECTVKNFTEFTEGNGKSKV